MIFQLFEQVCNLSISASWLIIAVLAARYLMRNTSKKYSCMLWILVGIRLLVPFSIESSLSLVPTVNVSNDSQEYVPMLNFSDTLQRPSAAEMPQPEAAVVQPHGTTVTESTHSPVQKPSFTEVLPYLWIAGVTLMLIYFFGTALFLKYRLSMAVRLDHNNIYQCEYIASPFVFGIVSPKIYVPYHLDKDSLEYVLLHENVHIRRKDHWTKAAAFLILSIYWFHPLVWVSYVLLSKDIEMACDEQVIVGMDAENRRFYSLALLNCHGKRKWYHACPVGFGELNVKERVLHVKNYRKPTLWITLICLLLCAAVAVCFFTNRKKTITEEPQAVSEPSETEAERIYVKSKPVQWTFSPSTDEFFPFRIDDSLLSAATHTEVTCEEGKLLYYDPDSELSESPEYFEMSGLFYWAPETGDDDSMTAEKATVTFKFFHDEDLLYSGTIDIVHTDVNDTQSLYEATLNSNDQLALKQLDYNMGASIIPEASVGHISISDLRHDHNAVDVFVREIEPGNHFEVSVKDQGRMIWSTEASTDFADRKTIMIYYDVSDEYLVQYQLTISQGIGSYTCTVFSLKDEKQTIIKNVMWNMISQNQ